MPEPVHRPYWAGVSFFYVRVPGHFFQAFLPHYADDEGHSDDQDVELSTSFSSWTFPGA